MAWAWYDYLNPVKWFQGMLETGLKVSVALASLPFQIIKGSVEEKRFNSLKDKIDDNEIPDIAKFDEKYLQIFAENYIKGGNWSKSEKLAEEQFLKDKGFSFSDYKSASNDVDVSLDEWLASGLSYSAYKARISERLKVENNRRTIIYVGGLIGSVWAMYNVGFK